MDSGRINRFVTVQTITLNTTAALAHHLKFVRGQRCCVRAGAIFKKQNKHGDTILHNVCFRTKLT